ncbi:MAG: heme-binding domain-containing protein [Bacteroidia bacterium]|nr:heme-binding domain-containing protein [Bacteroidia bacterium]
MKKYFTLKKISLIVLALLLVSQFFRIDKSTKPVDSSKDFISLTSPPGDLANVLKTSCYDCHSNQPNYPWYTNVAPISWWIKNHINEGSHHLNFSEWGAYSSKKQDHKLEECVEMIEEGEMPMSSYTLIHGNAKLSKEQQQQLMDWFNSLRTHESDKPSESGTH